jgi:bidirectional [NiFe] hydrogenase diaphorase subunit
MGEIVLQIDGKEVKAQTGMTLLEAAKSAGIFIPALCFHERLEPYGACRICTVEIEAHGRTRLVASCLYPAEANLVVSTCSTRVKKIRKLLLEMILAKAPESKALQDLAHEYGVERVRFQKEPSFCILCGLCVRYCAEVKKKYAVGFIGRGINREINFVPEIALKACPGCRECFSICPTCAIQTSFVLTQARMCIETFPDTRQQDGPSSDHI